MTGGSWLGELMPGEASVVQGIVEREVVRIVQELIRRRSDFPPGDTRGAIAVVSQELESVGIVPRRLSKDPARESLLAEIGEGSSGPVLLYHAHIDTVPAGELSRWDCSPFGGEEVEGAIHGRGAGDCKGSVAAQVAAVKVLARSGVLLGGRLRLAIVADEESGGELGTKWLLDEGHLNVDQLVIGEPTNNHISVAERVACGINLVVHGERAHGATPWEGENAVLKTSRAVTFLADELFPILKLRTHPFLPPPTLNIGKITGGVQWNIVPERCMVEMDRRLLPGETRERAVEEIRAILERFSSEVEPVRFELHSEGEVAPNVETNPSHPFVQTAVRALQDLTHEDRPMIGYVHTSDGRWFANQGIPIIHFGPGDPALAHAAGEKVHGQQLIEASRFLVLFAMRWLDHERRN